MTIETFLLIKLLDREMGTANAIIHFSVTDGHLPFLV